MGGDLTETGTLYSPTVGLIYVFNLIVGTGALTMPKAFSEAGWLLSLILVIILAFLSYLTVTFMIETMASANAVRRWHRIEKLKQHRNDYIFANKDKISENNGPDLCGDVQAASSDQQSIEDTDEVDERSPLISQGSYGDNNQGEEHGKMHHVFEITERIEMGQMASIFFNKVGINLFYITMAVYLYGDLAIYAAAVPKSLRDVACTYRPAAGNSSNSSTCNNQSLADTDPCWPNISINRIDAYRIFLAAFTLMLGPFVFFNVQKTKYLQIFTSLMRWLSFSMMIVLAVIRLNKGEGEGHPPMANFEGVPTLFGVCVYSFMCHHSLPSLATPISDKSRLLRLFAADYTLILGFYSLLSFTGIYSFSNLQDLYTLNFQPNSCAGDTPITNIQFIQYFLALFPVFTLSTNFPIIAITLRNNLKTMILYEDRSYPLIVDKIAFPFLTLIPPLIIAFITNRVDVLVGITGSYAGAGIQYIIPAALVLVSRRHTSGTLKIQEENIHTSPFRHTGWVIAVFIWALLCIGFVTVNHILQGK